MAARPSPDRRTGRVAVGPLNVQVGTGALPFPIRAHLDDGRVVGCTPPPDLLAALDAERCGSSAAHFHAFLAGLPVREFLRQWTRLEVAVKVCDGEPGALLRGARDLLAGKTPPTPTGWTARTSHLGDVVVTVAWKRRSRRRAERLRPASPPDVNVGDGRHPSSRREGAV